MLAETDGLNNDKHQTLQVVLPAKLSRFWNESGYEPSTAQEMRHKPRLRVRAEAEIEFTYLPIPLRARLEHDQHATGKILIKDMSRTGFSILYHEQIFPHEEFLIRFGDHKLKAKAVRCRKQGPKCYETGALILAKLPS